jgi:hypothetical protein
MYVFVKVPDWFQMQAGIRLNKWTGGIVIQSDGRRATPDQATPGWTLLIMIGF